jgi:cytochrome b pre-mRNA-processing protein 3
MKLTAIFHQFRRRRAVMSAYNRIAERARDPLFFAEWGVPDTLDGRFEMLSLHAFLVFNRLKADAAITGDFAQDLFDTMFADLDRGLREMGATDMGVGRHVKAMARGLYGRLAAYEHGLSDGNAALEDALRRNLYGTASPKPAQLEMVRHYLQRQVAALKGASVTIFLAGEVPFSTTLAEGR